MTPKPYRNRRNIIDISVPLVRGMPSWPESTSFRLIQVQKLESGDSANVSRLECEVHAGTHLDAPRHFLANGAAVDEIALDVLIGRAIVAFFPDAEAITAEHLSSIEMPVAMERLLLRTRNSGFWNDGIGEFRTDYVALTEDGAQWIVDRQIKLIGIDYLSIERYGRGWAVHRTLLDARTVILEGLNLTGVEPGMYQLICLPLKLVGVEGALARAVLVRAQDQLA